MADRKRTWLPCSRSVITALLSSPTCSASPALLSTGRWNGSECGRSGVSAAPLADTVCCPAWHTLRDSNALFVLCLILGTACGSLIGHECVP